MALLLSGPPADSGDGRRGLGEGCRCSIRHPNARPVRSAKGAHVSMVAMLRDYCNFVLILMLLEAWWWW